MDAGQGPRPFNGMEGTDRAGIGTAPEAEKRASGRRERKISKPPFRWGRPNDQNAPPPDDLTGSPLTSPEEAKAGDDAAQQESSPVGLGFNLSPKTLRHLAQLPPASPPGTITTGDDTAQQESSPVGLGFDLSPKTLRQLAQRTSASPPGTIMARAQRFEGSSPPLPSPHAVPPFPRYVPASPHMRALSPEDGAPTWSSLPVNGGGHRYTKSMDALMGNMPSPTTRLPPSPALRAFSQRGGFSPPGAPMPPSPWLRGGDPQPATPRLAVEDPYVVMEMMLARSELNNARLKRRMHNMNIWWGLRWQRNIEGKEDVDVKMAVNHSPDSDQNWRDDPALRVAEVANRVLDMHKRLEMELHLMHARTAKALGGKAYDIILGHATAAFRIAHVFDDPVLLGRCHYWRGIGNYHNKDWGHAVNEFQKSGTAIGVYLMEAEVSLAVEAAMESAKIDAMVVEVKHLGRWSADQARRQSTRDCEVEAYCRILRKAEKWEQEAEQDNTKPREKEFKDLQETAEDLMASESEVSPFAGAGRDAGEEANEGARTWTSSFRRLSHPAPMLFLSNDARQRSSTWASNARPLGFDSTLSGAINHPLPQRPWRTGSIRSIDSLKSVSSFETNENPLGYELAEIGDGGDAEYDAEAVTGRDDEVEEGSEAEDMTTPRLS